jgi:ribonucleoside-triphosphate reductase (thioredoxin)
MTGIASGKVLKLDLTEAANIIKGKNKITAKQIGINSAARSTLIKPSGTTSLVLGSSSGIHAALGLLPKNYQV